MSNNEKYSIQRLSFDSMLGELDNTSPLHMSKKLIEYELYDQQDSLEILNRIYEEFESKNNLVDELVTPVFLNICDGLLKHPKLKLKKTGITASRLVGEIKNFSYDSVHSLKRDMIQDKANLDQNTKDNTLDRKYKASENRNVYDDPTARKKYKENHRNKNGVDEYSGKKLQSSQTDHIVTLEQGVKEYGKSKYLKDENIKKALNIDANYAEVEGSLNQSKGGQSNEKYIKSDKPLAKEIDEKTKNTMKIKGEEAKKAVEKDLNKEVAKNLKDDVKGIVRGESQLINDAKKQAIDDSKHRALGEVVILIIKPIYYEFSDIFKNGMISDLNVTDKIEAFIERMKRVKNYVINNAIGTIFDNIKDFLKNFITMIINGIVNAFVGLLKKILQVISEGFTSIIEAIKIMMKPSEELSPSQKADAITKLLATTVITFLGAYFEETILSAVPEDIRTIVMTMLTGIASTVVVWLLDQADIFSVKDEKRMMRVKEIFELRIETIKKNTDIFEKASLELLAKQKLQFRKIADNISQAIDKNLPVNETVYQMADFMKVDLKVKSSYDFLNLLRTNEKIVI